MKKITLSPKLIPEMMLVLMLSLLPLINVEAETVVLRGIFEGGSTHTTSGSVDIVKMDNGTHIVRLSKDFFQDGAPDPFLGFGNFAYDEATEIAPLKSNRGEQTYLIPQDINVLRYVKFFVWCKLYAVPLGVAYLKPQRK